MEKGGAQVVPQFVLRKDARPTEADGRSFILSKF